MQTQSHEHGTAATAPFGGTAEPSRQHVQPSRELTANDLLQRIDMLINETAYLRESVEALASIENSGPGNPHSPGDLGTQAKAKAIATVVEQRELTNQKMIALLDRMYDDLSATAGGRHHPRSPEETKLLERLIDQAPEMSEETLRTFLDKLA